MREVEAILNFVLEQKKQTVSKYKILNKYVEKGKILFVGSSLMEYFPINELQQKLEDHYYIYNRGVAGSVSTELLASMEECIFELEPSKIFINIGTNDIGVADYKLENLTENYDRILTQISERLPLAKVYVMAYYPVNPKAVDLSSLLGPLMAEVLKTTRTNQAIREANVAIKGLAEKHRYEFIDVNEGLMDEYGNLKEEFTMDGVHMYANGYSVVLNNLKKFL